MGRRRSPRKQVRKLATARVHYLFERAVAFASERPNHSRYCVHTARRVARKARMKLPRPMSRRACKCCDTLWVPGKNCRVRTRSRRDKHIVVTCLVCGSVRRFPVIKQS